MSESKGLETTFNKVCIEYDKWRPNYPKELYDDIFRKIEINQYSDVLEIGIGTGQATKPILETGCNLIAIELGDHLAEFSKEKYNKYDRFSVKNMSFEDFETTPNSFNLIYSATAFHWIPEEVGYPKVYHMLKSGGIFARFANHPNKDNENHHIHIALEKIYAKYMPGSKDPGEYTEENAKKIADLACKYGFDDVGYKLYHRTRSFSAEEYIRLLGTYSDHIALEERKRLKLFDEIKQTIHDNGGIITVYDTIDLALSRKP